MRTGKTKEKSRPLRRIIQADKGGVNVYPKQKNYSLLAMSFAQVVQTLRSL